MNRRRAALTVTAVLAAAAVVFAAARGCTLLPWAGKAGGSVLVSISRDFGSELLKEGRVPLGEPGMSAMDALKEVAEVRTAYGGGFVSSVDGIRSSAGAGGGKDWFYYVNGVLAGRGALDYEVRDGDHIWWDYHGWNDWNLMPAVVGSYPHPFTKGHGGKRKPAVIAFGGPLEGLARKVGEYLEGKGARVSFSRKPFELMSGGADGPSMVILSAKEAGDSPVVRDMLKGGKGAAVPLSIHDGNLVPLNSEGKPLPRGEEVAAAVIATGKGIGDSRPLWLVLCEGGTGAQQAERLLVSQPAALRCRFGVAAGKSGRIFGLPGGRG